MKKTNKKSILILSIILPLLIIGLFVAWKVGRLKIGADISAPATAPLAAAYGIVINQDNNDAAPGIKIALTATDPATLPFEDLKKNNTATSDADGMFKILSFEKQQAKQRLTVYSDTKKYYDGTMILNQNGGNILRIQISDISPDKSNAIIVATTNAGEIAQKEKENQQPELIFGSLGGVTDPNAKIVLVSSDGGKLNFTADINGKFAKDKLPVGKYSITSITNANETRRTEIEIKKGQKTTIDFLKVNKTIAPPGREGL